VTAANKSIAAIGQDGKSIISSAYPNFGFGGRISVGLL